MLGWVDAKIQEGDITNLVIFFTIAIITLFTKKIIDYLYSKNISLPWWVFVVFILIDCLICFGIMCLLWSHPIIINNM